MSGRFHIKRNSWLVLLSNIFRLVTNVILFVVIARSYEPEEFGRFATAHLFSTVFLLVADFGFDQLLVASVPRKRETAAGVFQGYLSTKIVFACIASLVMATYGLLGGMSTEAAQLMVVFSVYVLLSSLANYFFALFKSFEAMEEETKVAFLMNSLLLVSILVLASQGVSVLVLSIAFVGSRIVGLTMACWRANKYVPLRKFRFKLVSRIELRKVWVFGLHAILGAMYFVQDTFLLSAWLGDYAAGVYQAVFKLVFLGLIGGDVLLTSLLPVLTRLNANDQTKWGQLGWILHKTMLYFSLPVSLLMVAFSREIIQVVYGERYLLEAPILLQLLGVVVLLRYVSDASGTMLTSSERQSARLKVVASAVPINLFLNFYTIPRFGVEGAAIASLATAAYVAFGYVFFAWKHVGSWFMDVRSYAPLLVAVILGPVLRGFGIPLVLAGPVSVLAILGIAYLVGYTSIERGLLFTIKGSDTMQTSQSSV